MQALPAGAFLVRSPPKFVDFPGSTVGWRDAPRRAPPRRSEITHAIGSFNVEDLIVEQDMVVTVSHQGYVKRLPVDTYRAQRRGGRGLRGMDTKEEDFVEHLFEALGEEDVDRLENVGVSLDVLLLLLHHRFRNQN